MARTQLNPVADQAELLPVEIPPAARHPKVRMITRSEIFPDPEQPRQQADAELRDSLARNGMLQPITVRRHPSMVAGWMIVDGERRWRSAEGVMEDLPCIVREDMEELPRRLATQLEANTGKSLTPLEEARAFGKLIDETGASVADLAKLLGRAPSTIAERVALLELGPWLPAIEGGALVMSHAVKVLLPLRGIADEIHAKVVEQMYGGDLAPAEDGHELRVDEFRREVMQQYKPFLYPLTKSKHYGAKNPEFNTAKHDAECGCGGITVAIGYESARRYCGNPEWWKPLERAAKKAAKAKEAKSPASKSQDDGKALYLPPEAKKAQAMYGSTPKGVIQITDSEGRWHVRTYGDEDERFDPKDLEINGAKLVHWKGYSGYECVGTTDAAAVKRARDAWRARFDAEYEALSQKLGAELEAERHAYRVEGPGIAVLLGHLDIESLEAALDVAKAIGWAIPERVQKARYHERDTQVLAWLATLNEREASVLLSSIATIQARGLTLPSDAVEELEKKAIEGIQKRQIPWKAKPKTEKPAKGAKAKAGAKKSGKKPASKLPLSKLSAETAELPLAEDPLATFRDEEAELTLADERAAAGAFDEDEEADDPGIGAGWDDDSDDLWDDAGDELEEAEA